MLITGLETTRDGPRMKEPSFCTPKFTRHVARQVGTEMRSHPILNARAQVATSSTVPPRPQLALRFISILARRKRGPLTQGQDLNRLSGLRRLSSHVRVTYFIVLGATLLASQALASAHVFPTFALPAPSAVWQAFTTLTSSGYLGSTLQQDLVVSLVRVSTAFVAGVVIGVAIGVAMSQNRVVFAAIDPFLQFLRPIPPLAYVPLFVVWFGTGELPKILLILVSVVPVIILNTTSGVRSIPSHRLEVARNLGATRGQILRRVVLPSALPEIMSGMKVAIGVA